LRVPLRWLSEYVDIDIDPQELANRLTTAGVEVGEIITTGGDWDGIRVAEVLEVKPHPNADRLCLATVDRGGGEKQTVVCGAPNVAAGQKVAFAAAGTTLLDGKTGKAAVLKPATVRGVESAGMVLSEKELGISESHEGILVLPEDSKVGAPLSSVLGDVIFDLDLTPNRPDLFSILGVAREVAALTGGKVRDPSIEFAAKGKPAKGRVKVEIRDPDLCPRYTAALVENVKIALSPPWMQERLIAAGLRPINNVVDITNYVMLETGQPLHAFDFTRLAEGTIIVRRPRRGEKIRLLDGSEHDLGPDMCLIADAEEAVALGGIMGGGESEVSEDTTSVLVEVANFSGPSIRRTAHALKLRTDASTRFEKGLSPFLPPIASARAVNLLVELCGGRAAEGLIDAWPGKEKEPRVTLMQERLTRILGVELPAAEVRRILTALGFGARWVPPDRYIVRVPYWRSDVTIADDVIEEVARIAGYDRMPTTQLRGEIPHAPPQPLPELRERVRDTLVAAGLQEIITYSMTTMEALAKVLPPEEMSTNPPLKLANPLSRDHEYARTTLRHNLLQTLASNRRGDPAAISLFEIGMAYMPREDDLPDEVETVCAVTSGRKPDRWGHPAKDAAGFFDAKSQLDAVFAALGVEAAYADANDFACLPGRTAEVTVGGKRVAIAGQVHPKVAASFDIDEDVAMFELDLAALLPHVRPIVHFEPISPYPPVEQDLAIIVPHSVQAAQVLALIEGYNLVASARIFDVYTGDPIPKGKKSMAFSISFQSPKKTLTDEDVAKERTRIIARLQSELSAEIRG
jgi:phenylalanyl-tRNA synthetase beta chain